MNHQTQDLISVLIGGLAAIYLIRRWWPTWKALLTKQSPASACQTSAAADCSSGCGNCGAPSGTPRKVHQVRWVQHSNK